MTIWAIVVFVLDDPEDVGHLDFLEKAAAEGNFVIVGLHTDPVSVMLQNEHSCMHWQLQVK